MLATPVVVPTVLFTVPVAVLTPRRTAVVFWGTWPSTFTVFAGDLTAGALVAEVAVFVALFKDVAAGFVVPAGFEAGAMVFLTGVLDTVLVGVVVVLAGIVVVFAAGVTVFFGVTVLAGVVVGFDAEPTADFVAGALLTGVAAGFEVVPVGVVFLTAGLDATGVAAGFFAGVEAAGVEVFAAFSFRGTRLAGAAAAPAVPEAAPVTLFAGVVFAAAVVVFAMGFFAAGWVPATLDTLSRLDCSVALCVLRSSTTAILKVM